MKLMCKKFKEVVRKVVLSRYEHGGIVLEDVEANQCPNCGEFVFTEEQIEEVEKRQKL